MSTRRTAFIGILACVGCAITACGGSGSPGQAAGPSTATAAPHTTSATSSSSAPASTTRSSHSTGAPTSSPAGSGSCTATTYAHLSARQRVGQLVMVALDTSQSTSAIDQIISAQHVGNIVYLGGWYGSDTVARTSKHLQQQATSAATGGVGLLVAADQEGGEVQQLKGPGFSTVPSALDQGTEQPAVLQRNAATMGREMKDAGVNVDLAPVADTVPASLGGANAPIGRFDREYGHTPDAVAKAVPSVVRGLHSAGVVATLKHFPGIGRITGNTDETSVGITDSVMTRHDSYLQPFSAGIKAGAGMVMIGFARYPKVDATHQAAFSSRVIDGMLRHDLGFGGVVISDDLHAVAARDVPEGQRAVRFIAAGGDIALTGATWSAPTIVAAILSRSATDKGFAKKVSKSVHRVLALKQRTGLLPCGKK